MTALGGTLAATWPVHVHAVAVVNVAATTGPPSPNCTLTDLLVTGPRPGVSCTVRLPVTTNDRGTTAPDPGEATCTKSCDIAGSCQCVNAAKSVDTASSLALKARYRAGRYCATSPSISASTARSLARSSVSSNTWRSTSDVQSTPGTGGTARSTHCGA